jgi:hypothetical protein
MILKWNKPSVTKICGTFIYPGNNIIPAELEEKVKNDPFVTERVKLGLITIIEPAKESTKEETKKSASAADNKTPADNTNNIAEMSVKDAIAIIEGMLHIPILEEMKKSEKANKNRSSIQTAIKKQIALIKEADPKE